MPAPHPLRSFARSLLLLIALVLASAPRLHSEKVKDLRPQGYVNDFASVLSAPARDKLTALCAEVDHKADAQIAVVTVSSLEDQPVEQFTHDLFTAWGVGPKQKDRGVMILVAPNDRKYWTEVGYGLEPILPDGKVGGFGREAVPLLRQNDYSNAALLITARVAAVIAADRGIVLESLSGAPAAPAPENNSERPLFPMSAAIWGLIFIIFIFSPVLGFVLRLLFGGWVGPRRGGRWGGGPWYGGGWSGGGSWGGGGFSSGGGGGFGGFGGGSSGGGGAGGGW